MTKLEASSWAAQLAPSAATSPVPQRLMGAVHIMCASGETIPNIVGMREFSSRSCVIMETEQEASNRLRDICKRMGVVVLNRTSSGFILSPFHVNHNAEVGRFVSQFLSDRVHPEKPLLWNYTVGTKPMMIGLERGLSAMEERAAGYDKLYVDTREPAPLFLGSQPNPSHLNRPMGVADLLLAQGIYWRSAIVLRRHNGTIPPLGERLHDPTCWLRARFPAGQAAFSRDNTDAGTLNWERVELPIGEWLTCVVAQALLAANRVDEIWIGTRVAPDEAFASGTDQEIDLMFAVQSRLYVCECKLNKLSRSYRRHDGTTEVEVVKPGDLILKIAKVAAMVGGRLAQPVFISNPKLLSDAARLKASHHRVWAIGFHTPQAVVEEFDRLILSV